MRSGREISSVIDRANDFERSLRSECTVENNSSRALTSCAASVSRLGSLFFAVSFSIFMPRLIRVFGSEDRRFDETPGMVDLSSTKPASKFVQGDVDLLKS